MSHCSVPQYLQEITIRYLHLHPHEASNYFHLELTSKLKPYETTHIRRSIWHALYIRTSMNCDHKINDEFLQKKCSAVDKNLFLPSRPCSRTYVKKLTSARLKCCDRQKFARDEQHHAYLHFRSVQCGNNSERRHISGKKEKDMFNVIVAYIWSSGLIWPTT